MLNIVAFHTLQTCSLESSARGEPVSYGLRTNIAPRFLQYPISDKPYTLSLGIPYDSMGFSQGSFPPVRFYKSVEVGDDNGTPIAVERIWATPRPRQSNRLGLAMYPFRYRVRRQGAPIRTYVNLRALHLVWAEISEKFQSPSLQDPVFTLLSYGKEFLEIPHELENSEHRHLCPDSLSSEAAVERIQRILNATLQQTALAHSTSGFPSPSFPDIFTERSAVARVLDEVYFEPDLQLISNLQYASRLPVMGPLARPGGTDWPVFKISPTIPDAAIVDNALILRNPMQAQSLMQDIDQLHVTDLQFTCVSHYGNILETTLESATDRYDGGLNESQMDRLNIFRLSHQAACLIETLPALNSHIDFDKPINITIQKTFEEKVYVIYTQEASTIILAMNLAMLALAGPSIYAQPTHHSRGH